jgi:hypothetical protein
MHKKIEKGSFEPVVKGRNGPVAVVGGLKVHHQARSACDTAPPSTYRSRKARVSQSMQCGPRCP